MAVKPWIAVWSDAPADSLEGWEMPWNDMPTPGLNGCCVGCPGASHRQCCSSDPERVWSRFAETDVPASGVLGRRRLEFFHRWLQRRETRQETTR